MSFIKDLKDGEEAEGELLTYFHSCGLKTGFNTSTTVTEKRFFDIWAKKEVPNKPRKPKKTPVETFEVKYDRKASSTGNVYFEHETLENSRADFIVYKLDTGQFYIQGRGAVLNFLHNPAFKQVSGGDAWGLGTLIPVPIFKELFSEIEKVYKKETPEVSQVAKK